MRNPDDRCVDHSDDAIARRPESTPTLRADSVPQLETVAARKVRSSGRGPGAPRRSRTQDLVNAVLYVVVITRIQSAGAFRPYLRVQRAFIFRRITARDVDAAIWEGDSRVSRVRNGTHEHVA